MAQGLLVLTAKDWVLAAYIEVRVGGIRVEYRAFVCFLGRNPIQSRFRSSRDGFPFDVDLMVSHYESKD